MRKKYDIVATVGKYTDRQSGEEKKRYQNVGAVFEDDNGRLSIKLDTVPITPEWSGWLACYEPDRERGGSRGQSAAPAPQRESRDNSAAMADADDDIPFAPIPFLLP